jgi:hypothetical protein
LRGLVAYAYDTAIDDKSFLMKRMCCMIQGGKRKPRSALLWGWFPKVGVLLVLISGRLCLFIIYLVLTFIGNNSGNLPIEGNISINAAGKTLVW